jgi:hypothetical protein
VYLERWGSYTGADEVSNVLEYYAVSTGKYLATPSSSRKALLGLLDPPQGT